MIHRFLSAFLVCLTIAPSLAFAQSGTTDDTQQTFEAKIAHVQNVPCPDKTPGCKEWILTGQTGVMAKKPFIIITNPQDAIGTSTPNYQTGDSVVVQTQLINGERHFILSDIVRRGALIWLFMIFIALVWLFGGTRSLLSFAGMVASLLVIFFYILPRILAGDSPLFTALIGSLLIMALTFVPAHGWKKKTFAAFIGTTGSLILTAVLASFFGMYAHLTGLADESMSYLLSDYPNLDTAGILLAAIIIGTLGVLNDITIAQASAVFELRAANPRLRVKELYQSAYRIGTDHIAAAVNTLILAYAGTALPLLLLLVGVPSGESWWTFINRETISTEIVRTLVGSIGLLAAVPLTTWVASVMAMRTNPAEIDTHDGHGHHH